jgi:hypothetical protein
MKKNLLTITLGVCLLGILSPAATRAKGKKNKAPTENALAKYDANKDGQLDATEVSAIKKEFAANKTESLKQYDSNADGKIEDAEVDGIKADFSAAPKLHKKKKNQ